VESVFVPLDLVETIAGFLVRCSDVECGSLAREDRPLRPDGQSCACDNGWEGIHCNGNAK
jgi:hypothetical protein